MGRRAGYYIDPLAFLEFERRRVEGLPAHLYEYAIGLIGSWRRWADDNRLDLPERLLMSDALRCHLAGVADKPGFLDRGRGLASEERCVGRLRSRMRMAASTKRPVPSTGGLWGAQADDEGEGATDEGSPQGAPATLESGATE